MFGVFKIYLLSYWRGNKSLSDICLFSLEIHVFTHHSPKSQFWDLLLGLLEWQNFVMQASPNSYLITITWSLVFTCNFSGIKLVSVVNHNYSHSLALACKLKQVLRCLDHLSLLWENIVTVNAANTSTCESYTTKFFNTYIVSWWSSTFWIYP